MRHCKALSVAITLACVCVPTFGQFSQQQDFGLYNDGVPIPSVTVREFDQIAVGTITQVVMTVQNNASQPFFRLTNECGTDTGVLAIWDREYAVRIEDDAAGDRQLDFPFGMPNGILDRDDPLFEDSMRLWGCGAGFFGFGPIDPSLFEKTSTMS